MDSPQEAHRRRKTSPSFQPLYIISGVIVISAISIAIVFLFMANGYFSMTQTQKKVLQNAQNGAVEEALKQEIARIKEAGNSATTIPVAIDAPPYQPDLKKEFPNCFLPKQQGMQQRQDIAQLAIDCPFYYEISSPMSQRVFSSNANSTQFNDPVRILFTYSTQKQGELPQYLNYTLYQEKPPQEMKSELLTGFFMPGNATSGPLLLKSVVTNNPVRVLIDGQLATGVVVDQYECYGSYEECTEKPKSLLVQVEGGYWLEFLPPEKDSQKLNQADVVTSPVFEFDTLVGAEL